MSVEAVLRGMLGLPNVAGQIFTAFAEDIDRVRHAAFPCSKPRNARSSFSRLWSVAPMGSGFRSETFHRLNVVGCTPASMHTFRMDTRAASALASIALMMSC